MSYQVKITPSGRLSLPAELRKRLGLSDGGTLLVEETEDVANLGQLPSAVSPSAKAAWGSPVRPERYLYETVPGSAHQPQLDQTHVKSPPASLNELKLAAKRNRCRLSSIPANPLDVRAAPESFSSSRS